MLFATRVRGLLMPASCLKAMSSATEVDCCLGQTCQRDLVFSPQEWAQSWPP